MTNNPTKYEQILSNRSRGVAIIKCHELTDTNNMFLHRGVSVDNISHDFGLTVRIARNILEWSPLNVHSSQLGFILLQ